MKFLFTFLCPLALFSQTAWINEFHYDNIGTDTLEFIEVVLPVGDSVILNSLELTVYNGATGKPFSQSNVSTWVPGDTTNGYLFFYTWVPLQNGPEALGLSSGYGLLQTLFFESTFPLISGPAMGSTGALVPISEDNTTPWGTSICRVGSGSAASHFGWSDATMSPGSINDNQSLVVCGSPSSPGFPSVQHLLGGLLITPQPQGCGTYFLLGGSTVGFPFINNPSVDSLGLSNLWQPPLGGTNIEFLDTSSESFDLMSLPEDSLLYFTLLSVNPYGHSAASYFTARSHSYDSLWVSEILFNPSGGLLGEKHKEWVELYNASSDSLSVEGWWVFSGVDSSQLSGPLTTIPPKHYLVLGTSEDTSQNGQAPVDISYGLELRLSNVTDSFSLKDPAGGVLQKVVYSSLLGWPACPDNFSMVWNGKSSSELASSWDVSKVSGGSPGASPFEFRYTRQRWYPKIPSNSKIDTLWVGDHLVVDSLVNQVLTVYQDTLEVLPRGLLRTDSAFNAGVVILRSSLLGSSQAFGPNYSEGGLVVWEFCVETPGWKMLANPLRESSFKELSEQVILQFSGSINGANLFYWDSEIGTWTAPDGENSASDSCGMMLYLDGNFTKPGEPFPLTLHFAGNGWNWNSYAPPNQHNLGSQWGGGYNGQVNQGWSLWKNPFPSSLSWNLLMTQIGTGLSSVYYVWNNASSSWEFSDGQIGTPGLSSNIGPGQAFFVRILDTNQVVWQLDTSMVSLDTLQFSLKSNEHISLLFDSAGAQSQGVFLKNVPSKAVGFSPDSDGATPSSEWSLLLLDGLDSAACSLVSFDFSMPSTIRWRERKSANWNLTVKGDRLEDFFLVFSSGKRIRMDSLNNFSLTNNTPRYITNTPALSMDENPSAHLDYNPPCFDIGLKKYWVWSLSGKLVCQGGPLQKGEEIKCPLVPGTYVVSCLSAEGFAFHKKWFVP